MNIVTHKEIVISPVPQVPSVHGVVVHDHSHQLRHDDQRGAHRGQQVRQLLTAHVDGHPRQRVLLAGALQVQAEDAAAGLLHGWRTVLYLTAVRSERYVNI